MYVQLLLVMTLCPTQRVWIGLSEPTRYTEVFPGAQGWLFNATMAASAAAALNALLVWRTANARTGASPSA